MYHLLLRHMSTQLGVVSNAVPIAITPLIDLEPGGESSRWSAGGRRAEPNEFLKSH